MTIIKRFVVTIYCVSVLHFSEVRSITPPSQKIRADEAPFAVYISSDNFYCTGVILSERIVLTAVHCAGSSVTVVAGRSYIFNNTNSQSVAAERVLKHESYSLENEVQAFYDICLILLSTPLTFNRYVQPIEWTKQIDYEKPSTVYGWGAVDAIRKTPFLFLRSRVIDLIPDDTCIDMLKNAITECTKQVYELCAQKGSCHGDSGGPLTQKVDNVTKLIGIVAWGADDNIDCDSNPSVYENVGYFSKWIEDGIRDLFKESTKPTTHFTTLAERILQRLKGRNNDTESQNAIDPAEGDRTSRR